MRQAFAKKTFAERLELSARPTSAELLSQFKKLSQKWDPKSGGDAEMYRLMREARDGLIEEARRVYRVARLVDRLHLPANYTPQNLTASFKKLSALYHPDFGGDNELYRLLVEAYQHLKDGPTPAASETKAGAPRPPTDRELTDILSAIANGPFKFESLTATFDRHNISPELLPEARRKQFYEDMRRVLIKQLAGLVRKGYVEYAMDMKRWANTGAQELLKNIHTEELIQAAFKSRCLQLLTQGPFVYHNEIVEWIKLGFKSPAIEGDAQARSAVINNCLITLTEGPLAFSAATKKWREVGFGYDLSKEPTVQSTILSVAVQASTSPFVFKTAAENWGSVWNTAELLKNPLVKTAILTSLQQLHKTKGQREKYYLQATEWKKLGVEVPTLLKLGPIRRLNLRIWG